MIFEELGGNPTKISIVKRSVTTVCAEVTEFHPTIKNWHIESYGKSEEFHKPKAHLRCSRGQSISSIKFASFGTPMGTCGSYQEGACHASTSYAILEKVLNLFLVLTIFQKIEYFMLFNISFINFACISSGILIKPCKSDGLLNFVDLDINK